MKKIKEAEQRKLRRKKRIKDKIGRGVASRPRITVFKSNRYFYAQVIDDSKGHTIVSISTIEKSLNLGKNIDDVKNLEKFLLKGLRRKI